MAGWLGVAGRISLWINAYLIVGLDYINISKASGNIAHPIQEKEPPITSYQTPPSSQTASSTSQQTSPSQRTSAHSPTRPIASWPAMLAAKLGSDRPARRRGSPSLGSRGESIESGSHLARGTFAVLLLCSSGCVSRLWRRW
jgi:hypothetical protein